MTALKGGTPPQLAVLLSTDMFTLIDEDAIVPIDCAQERCRQEVAGRLLRRLHAEQPQRRAYLGRAVPALDHRDVLQQGPVQGAGLDPERAPATWAELVEYGKKLTKQDASGNTTQWGIEIPSGGAFAYWLFQA